MPALSVYGDLAALVPAIARRVKLRCPETISLEELEQTGRIALWEAAQRFDESRGVTFPAYAKMRIRGAMLDWIRTEFREAARERDAIRIDTWIDAGENLQRIAASSEMDPFIARAVERLGGRQAAVIGLRFYGGLSRIETGQRIGISPHAVARAERSAIGALQELLVGRAA